MRGASELLLLVLVCAGDISSQNVLYDVDNSRIWRCEYSNASTVLWLEDNPTTTVLYRDTCTVHFITSSRLPDTRLNNCSVAANVSDLLMQEWETITRKERPQKRSADIEDEWFQRYHNLTSIYSWYQDLAVEYPSLVETAILGSTHSGNDILVVHITRNNGESKPVVYIQCLLHAREWITGPVCAYVSRYLAQDPAAEALLSKFEFVVVPVANPDGYKLTWTDYPKFRFWRKNVSHREGSTCYGVDLNRNFAVKWSQKGASQEPCGDTYHGPFTGSELETAAIVKFLKNKRLVGAIDFHAFSQEVVYPYGWTTQKPDNAERLKSVAEQVALAASQVGKTYTSQQMGAVYLASGTFTDWLYQENPSAIPLTMELGPANDGSHDYTGFMVPTKEIIPTCKEIVLAILKFCSLLN